MELHWGFPPIFPAHMAEMPTLPHVSAALGRPSITNVAQHEGSQVMHPSWPPPHLCVWASWVAGAKGWLGVRVIEARLILEPAKRQSIGNRWQVSKASNCVSVCVCDSTAWHNSQQTALIRTIFLMSISLNRRREQPMIGLKFNPAESRLNGDVTP